MEVELERVLAKEEIYIELEKQVEVLRESDAKKKTVFGDLLPTAQQ